MKSWLKKFKLSAALDATSSSERARGPAGSPPEDLGEFEASLRRLDHQLKASRPAETVPDTLHESIMLGVRNAARHQEIRGAAPRINRGWLAAPALAVLAMVLWMAFNQRTSEPSYSAADPRSLEIATATLEAGRSVAQTAPAAVIAPLEREMSLLREDARRAMDLVLASLPQDAIAFAWSAENRQTR